MIKRYKLRFAIAIFIALMPFNKLRIFLYRLLLRYDISYSSKIYNFNIIASNNIVIGKNTFIGFFNIITTDTFILECGARVKHCNKFKSLKVAKIGQNSIIVSRNIFIGDFFRLLENNGSEIIIGDNSVITGGHHINLSDRVTIGDNVVIGGVRSQIWTHGYNLQGVRIQGKVDIGSNIYIASSVIIMPGVKIVDNVMIGAGSIVAKSILESGFYTSSKLEKKSEIPTFDLSELEMYGAEYIKRK